MGGNSGSQDKTTDEAAIGFSFSAWSVFSLPATIKSTWSAAACPRGERRRACPEVQAEGLKKRGAPPFTFFVKGGIRGTVGKKEEALKRRISVTVEAPRSIIRHP